MGRIDDLGRRWDGTGLMHVVSAVILPGEVRAEVARVADVATATRFTHENVHLEGQTPRGGLEPAIRCKSGLALPRCSSSHARSIPDLSPDFLPSSSLCLCALVVKPPPRSPRSTMPEGHPLAFGHRAERIHGSYWVASVSRLASRSARLVTSPAYRLCSCRSTDAGCYVRQVDSPGSPGSVPGTP